MQIPELGWNFFQYVGLSLLIAFTLSFIMFLRYAGFVAGNRKAAWVLLWSIFLPLGIYLLQLRCN